MIGSTVLLAATAFALTSPEAPREARFANPPGESRLLPIRHTPPLDPKANVHEITRLVERGFGGYAGNVAFGLGNAIGARYVENEAAWPSYVAGADFARKAGLALWLYDELGYPSLSAGDLVLRGHPELEQTGYLVATAAVKGGETVSLEVPPGKFLAAFAARTDAAGNLVAGAFDDVSAAVRDERPLPAPFALARTKPDDAAGRPALGLAKTRAEIRTGPFAWRAPAGADWRVYVVTEDYLYEGTHPECKGMKVKFRYPNPLVKAATERFCAVNHGAYARHFGNDLGRWFTSTFTDEPSLMGNWWRPMPYFVFSSAPELARRYRARTGRDLVADIPYLVTDSADFNLTSGERRIAFWDESARLYEEAFFKTISAWCRAHGFLSGGHLMGEETFAFHVSHYGDFFRCLKALDAPSLDCLTSIPEKVPYLAALFVGSARELTNASHTMVEVSDHCEHHRGTGKDYLVSEDEIQGTLNRLLWGGVTTFTSYYGMNRFTDETTRAINLRLGRAATLLRDGRSAADVALFYPAKDAMRLYRPQTHVWNDRDTPVRALQDVFDAAAKSLYEAGRVFLIIDEVSLEGACVEGDTLSFGDLRFRALVLPRVETLSEKARATLSAFEAAGGLVIRADAATDVAARLRGELEPHVAIRSFGSGRPCPVRVAHRHGREGDVFFLMNDSPEPFVGSARFCGETDDLVCWNLADGTFGPAYRTTRGLVKISLAPYRATVFTTSRRCEPRRHPPADAQPGPRANVLAKPPTIDSRNAEAKFERLADGACRATAVLRKAASDTFCFLEWGLAESPLAENDAVLRIVVEVPEATAVAPNLGVFLQTSDGASFFSGSRQSLGEKGVHTVDFPFAAFHAHKCQAVFAPEDVSRLRIGFGGFKAEAGVKVDFIVRSVEIRVNVDKTAQILPLVDLSIGQQSHLRNIP